MLTSAASEKPSRPLSDENVSIMKRIEKLFAKLARIKEGSSSEITTANLEAAIQAQFLELHEQHPLAFVVPLSMMQENLSESTLLTMLFGLQATLEQEELTSTEPCDLPPPYTAIDSTAPISYDKRSGVKLHYLEHLLCLLLEKLKDSQPLTVPTDNGAGPSSTTVFLEKKSAANLGNIATETAALAGCISTLLYSAVRLNLPLAVVKLFAYFNELIIDEDLAAPIMSEMLKEGFTLEAEVVSEGYTITCSQNAANYCLIVADALYRYKQEHPEGLLESHRSFVNRYIDDLLQKKDINVHEHLAHLGAAAHFLGAELNDSTLMATGESITDVKLSRALCHSAEETASRFLKRKESALSDFETFVDFVEVGHTTPYLSVLIVSLLNEYLKHLQHQHDHVYTSYDLFRKTDFYSEPSKERVSQQISRLAENLYHQGSALSYFLLNRGVESFSLSQIHHSKLTIREIKPGNFELILKLNDIKRLFEAAVVNTDEWLLKNLCGITRAQILDKAAITLPPESSLVTLFNQLGETSSIKKLDTFINNFNTLIGIINPPKKNSLLDITRCKHQLSNKFIIRFMTRLHQLHNLEVFNQTEFLDRTMNFINFLRQYNYTTIKAKVSLYPRNLSQSQLNEEELGLLLDLIKYVCETTVLDDLQYELMLSLSGFVTVEDLNKLQLEIESRLDSIEDTPTVADSKAWSLLSLQITRISEPEHAYSKQFSSHSIPFTARIHSQPARHYNKLLFSKVQLSKLSLLFKVLITLNTNNFQNLFQISMNALLSSLHFYARDFHGSLPRVSASLEGEDYSEALYRSKTGAEFDHCWELLSTEIRSGLHLNIDDSDITAVFTMLKIQFLTSILKVERDKAFFEVLLNTYIDAQDVKSTQDFLSLHFRTDRAKQGLLNLAFSGQAGFDLAPLKRRNFPNGLHINFKSKSNFTVEQQPVDQLLIWYHLATLIEAGATYTDILRPLLFESFDDTELEVLRTEAVLAIDRFWVKAFSSELIAFIENFKAGEMEKTVYEHLQSLCVKEPTSRVAIKFREYTNATQQTLHQNLFSLTDFSLASSSQAGSSMISSLEHQSEIDALKQQHKAELEQQRQEADAKLQIERAEREGAEKRLQEQELLLADKDVEIEALREDYSTFGNNAQGEIEALRNEVAKLQAELAIKQDSIPSVTKSESNSAKALVSMCKRDVKKARRKEGAAEHAEPLPAP